MVKLIMQFKMVPHPDEVHIRAKGDSAEAMAKAKGLIPS